MFGSRMGRGWSGVITGTGHSPVWLTPDPAYCHTAHVSGQHIIPPEFGDDHRATNALPLSHVSEQQLPCQQENAIPRRIAWPSRTNRGADWQTDRFLP